MPSIITHHIYSNKLYDTLNPKIQDTFKHEKIIYNTFAQSHDYLFYSNNRKVENIGHKAHHEKTKEYLLTIVQEILKNELQNDEQVIAYLYGAISHYCLDSICHPYIFYKTGIFRNTPQTLKYKGLHTKMEKELDAIYYEKTYHKKYYKCNISKEIIKKPVLSDDLINLINIVYLKVYNILDIGYHYEKCLKRTKRITSLAFQDKYGIKKAICRAIKPLYYNQYYSTYIKEPNLNWLNNEHKTWNHPCNKEETYNYSFDDLMNQALKKANSIIRDCHKVLFEKKDISILNKTIQDIDYSTGYLIDNNKRMDFYEF